MKAITMVAHPDDCVIFAYSFMHHYSQFDWTVCYLTYTEQDARGAEFAKFWKRRGVATKFLGYVDDYHDLETGVCSFDTAQATESIKQAITDQDLVLTHDHAGDYGHLHHKFIYDVVANNHSSVVTFAGINQGNVKYTIEPGVYSLDEFPLHQDIVSSFHQHTHANEYAVSNRVKNIL
jgi:LmbE family N-acetylglucosaminyl deacetylase